MSLKLEKDDFTADNSTTERVRELARLLFEFMNGRDFSLIKPYLAEDVKFDFPSMGCLEGIRKVERFMRMLFHNFPRLYFDVSRITCEKNVAAVEWKNSGHNIKNEPYKNQGVTIVELDKGLIVFVSDTFKDTSIFMKKA